MNKKVCAYCNNEFNEKRKRTAEHIFPKVLLELYPEQDISFTPEKIFKDNFGLTIADVCDICNNGILSELDNYGGKLISNEFFYEIDYEFKDKILKKEIQYEEFSKWVIKIAYNYLRSRKKNCDFLDKYIVSIVSKDNIPDGVSIFMGIHINTTPLPERCYEFLPLTIIENPILLGTSFGISMLYNLPLYMNVLDIDGVYEKLLIRLGNLVTYIVFWKEGDSLRQKVYEESITNNFNFVKLKKEKNVYSLKRITASTNMTMNYGHILSTTALHQDDMIVESSLRGRNVIEVRKLFEELRSEEDWKKSQLLVERSMFPNNRKVKNEYEKVFGKE